VASSLILITVVAVLAAVCGVALESVRGLSRKLVPFGGGMLLGVAAVWILPEMAEFFGWIRAIGWAMAGFGLLWAIDRFIHPVCPACSPGHEHENCTKRLHGFAMPLLVAAGVHAMADGWTLEAAHATAFNEVFAIGIAIHKLPEGIALGVMTRASMRSKIAAIVACAVAEGMTVAGGGFENALAAHLNPYSLYAVLAIAGGSFFYLGGHAVHGELRRSGAAPAFLPALTGVAGSGVLRWFVS
jgi:zinc and cadmium transporter